MKRLIDVLRHTPHRFIVSKGPQHAEYELASNMSGCSFLPQTSLMPLVDLVITHGGNNTTTEALHFGKPMVLLPLFWGLRPDDAQRMDERGFGRRLRTYEFTADELTGAVDSLLTDTDLRSRMDAMGSAIQHRGRGRTADVIERVAQKHRAGSLRGRGSTRLTEQAAAAADPHLLLPDLHQREGTQMEGTLSMAAVTGLSTRSMAGCLPCRRW